jgi:hypothetical protein
MHREIQNDFVDTQVRVSVTFVGYRGEGTLHKIKEMSKMVSDDPNLCCVRDGDGVEVESNRYFIKPALPLLFGSVVYRAIVRQIQRECRTTASLY